VDARLISAWIPTTAVVIALVGLIGEGADRRPSEPPADIAPALVVDGARDADPVDLATGLYTRTSDDFLVLDTVPIRFARVYVSGDTRALPFGIGTTHSYDSFMTGDLSAITVITDERSRIAYIRVDGGTGRDGARYEHRTTASRFQGSILSWAGDRWRLAFSDGSAWLYRSCRTQANPNGRCTLIGQQSPAGDQVSLVRDDLGRLVRMETPNGRWVRLEYDEVNRVTRGWDSTGRSMNYEYDASGRLARAIASTGERQGYEYDAAHRLTRITERDGVVITNTYDTAGRTIDQVITFPPEAPETIPPSPLTFGFRYGTAGTRITDVEVRQPDGGVRRVTLNSAGYILTETRTTGDGVTMATTYTRDGATNVVSAVEVACTPPGGETTRARATIGPRMSAETVVGVFARRCRMSETDDAL